jgi:hypothetical protein
MNSRQRRIRTIELTLTPQQIVVVWLRNALQAGTFEEGARHWPPYRGTVANAVYHTVRNSMKGQPEPLIERAILQARQQADLLYQFVVTANIAVFEDRGRREREYIFLLGHLGAELKGHVTKDRVENLRLEVLLFIEPVILLDAAIAQVAAEYFDGQIILFRDCEVKLQEQLQMVEALCKYFNPLAEALHVAQINLDQLRSSLQAEIDRKTATWFSQGRVTMLDLFGTPEETHAAIVNTFALLEPKSVESNNAVLG